MPPVIPLAFYLKFAYASTFTVVTAFAFNAYQLFLQVDTVGAANGIGQFIPSAALTGTSGALVWAMKQVVGGALVPRDSDATEKKLSALIDAAHKREASAERREAIYTDFLIGQRKENL